ncbi:hypothetical protein Afil01_56830 [Actinorhabdospora filicis]|uniref:Lipoprotein n=1 Tax=Actinorhabdospora filicis TaxID=1785913 RepID=A0A9W6SUA6_9ACTN|nr:hypothetical protein [Actinorhabdospora filicis]GLZ80876.1 hypothetical protein Afil01_56830 [Actinorhabdospora filicis]
MKLKSIVAVAALAGVALFGAACGTKDKPTDNASSSSNNAAEQKGDPKAELQAALKKSGEAKSMSVEGTSGDLTVSMSIDSTAKVAVMKLKGKIDGEDQDMEIRIFGEDAYIKLNSGEMAQMMKGKWMKTSSSEFGDVFEEKVFDDTQLISDTTKVERLAAGQFKLTEAGAGASGLFGKLKGEKGTGTKDKTTVTATVGADGRISAMESTGTKADDNYKMTVTGYDKPVTAEKPDPKDVVDTNSMGA